MTLLLIHFTAAVFMTGLIWLIQLVHYPSFEFVCRDNFEKFERFHTRSITWIVLPAMSVELLSSIYLLYLAANTWGGPWALGNFLSVVFLWGFTLMVSARIHSQLSNGFDPDLIQRLIKTNWVRTILWSVRSLVLLAFLTYQFSLPSQ